MSNNRPDDRKKPGPSDTKNSAVGFFQIPPEVARYILRFLGKKPQALLANAVTKADPLGLKTELTFLKEANQLITHIYHRDIKKIEEQLSKQPALLFEKGIGTDLSGQDAEDILYPLQAAVKVGDWFIWNILVEYFTQLYATDIALEQINQLDAMPYNYDLELLPEIPSQRQVIADKFPGYENIFIINFPEEVDSEDEEEEMPHTPLKDVLSMQIDEEKSLQEKTPKNAIALLCYQDIVFIYRWAADKLVKEKFFYLPNKGCNEVTLYQIVNNQPQVEVKFIFPQEQKNTMEGGELKEAETAKIIQSTAKMQVFAEQFYRIFAEEEGSLIKKTFFPVIFENLMTLCHYPLPELPHKPMLVKQLQDNNTFILKVWGNLNGKWKLTQMGREDSLFFNSLISPKSNAIANALLQNTQISKTMYDALKRYHSPSEYQFAEYIRVMKTFEQYAPMWLINFLNGGLGLAENYWCNEVKDAQYHLPPLAKNYFCSPVPFQPVPEYKEEKLETTFLLKGGGSFEKLDASNGAIVKGEDTHARGLRDPINLMNFSTPAIPWPIDRAAMEKLAEVMQEKRLALKESLSPKPATTGKMKF